MLPERIVDNIALWFFVMLLVTVKVLYPLQAGQDIRLVSPIAISKSLKQGLKQFITVHDSFATTGADIDKFIKIVRESFVELYTKNDCPIYKELPPIGDYDVTEVIKALYIFS